jgi:hypothetical protein
VAERTIEDLCEEAANVASAGLVQCECKADGCIRCRTRTVLLALAVRARELNVERFQQAAGVQAICEDREPPIDWAHQPAWTFVRRLRAKLTEAEAVSTARLEALQAAEPDAFRWRTVHPAVAAALTKLAVQAYGDGHLGELVKCALCKAQAYGKPIVHDAGCVLASVKP